MRRMTVTRGFARHMAGVDPGTEVPPPGLVTFRQRRRQPFIYSGADIAALMAHARRSIPTPLRAVTVETLIGLLAATGMRGGEAIPLERPDLLWAEAVIVVRDSKFGKSRLVPLHASAVAALAAYAGQRDRLQPWPKCPAFFVSTAGTALLYCDVCHTFRNLVNATGIRSPPRPKIHDIRHTFAVTTLVKLYRAAHDVQARLPRLSAVLGHQNPVSTYWYLSSAPKLLSRAADRLETHELSPAGF